MKRLFLIFLFVAAAGIFSNCARAQLVIANPSVKAVEITKSEVRDLFTGETRNLKEGGRVNPVFLKGGPAHTEFLLDFLHMPDAMVRTCWSRLVFAGQATMPRSFETEATLVEFIAHTPGAIGYITQTTPHEDVKVLILK